MSRALRTHRPFDCPLSRESYSIYISIFFSIIMRDSEDVSKKIFAQKKDRFRLKAVKIIESPGWKALPEHPGDRRVLSPTSAN